ncbi:MAG: OmpA family protein [Pseudomonadota bacterium]
MLRLVVVLPLVFALAFGIRALAHRAVPLVEAHLAREAGAVRDALGADWARIEVDGLRLSLAGEAPDAEARRLLAVTLTRSLPLAEVEAGALQTTVTPVWRGPTSVGLFRDENGVTLTGSFAGPGARADLLIAIGRALPGVAIRDLSGLDAGGEPPVWGAEIAVAIAALEDVQWAHVRIDGAQVRVEGLAPDAETRARVEARLRETSGPGLTLKTVLRVPRPPVVPFRLTVERTADGIAMPDCAARDEAEAARIAEALAALVEGAKRCRVGPGGPLLDWGAAALAGIAAVAALPAGRYSQTGTLASLEAGAPTDRRAFERALGGLAATLPSGMRLDARLVDTGDVAAAPAWLTIGRDAIGVQLAGRAPAGAALEALDDLARARLGSARVEAAALAPLDGPVADPATARLAPDALAVLEAMLARPLEGEARLAPGRVSIRAALGSGAEAAAMAREVAAALAPGTVLATRLTVDLPAAVAAVALPDAACAAALNRAVETTPIGFDPGSANVDAGGQRVLDRLAALMLRCQGARIEIGGHTDNQGRATMNRRLSRDRAEAVRAGLAARGVGPAATVLSARGYGEDQPVAPNDTAAGRAANRRIAFRVIEAGEDEGEAVQ